MDLQDYYYNLVIRRNNCRFFDKEEDCKCDIMGTCKAMTHKHKDERPCFYIHFNICMYTETDPLWKTQCGGMNDKMVDVVHGEYKRF